MRRPLPEISLAARRALALTILLLIIDAAPALAYTPHQLARALPVAYTIWPGNPCNSQVTVIADPDVSLGMTMPYRWHMDDGTPFVANPRCEIRLQPSIPRALDVCIVLGHELGHVGGIIEHTERGLMSEKPTTPRACRKAFK
jgi:hypothetical protein